MNKKLLPFLFLCFILFFLFGYFHSNNINNSIKKYGKNIVVKLVNIKDYPKTTNYYFTYYVGDSLIRTNNCGIKQSMFDSDSVTNSINNLEINSYYLAKFNPKYIDMIIVNPSKKIEDTLVIKKFGFQIKRYDWQKEMFSGVK